MSRLPPAPAAILLAFALAFSGMTLAATGPAPTLAGPIAPFGCYA